jgi:hypothetical protein
MVMPPGSGQDAKPAAPGISHHFQLGGLYIVFFKEELSDYIVVDHNC